MSIEETARKILEQQGYIVVAHQKRIDSFPHVWLGIVGTTGERLTHPVVAFAEASQEDWVRRRDTYCPNEEVKSRPPLAGWHYYKVTAE